MSNAINNAMIDFLVGCLPYLALAGVLQNLLANFGLL